MARQRSDGPDLRGKKAYCTPFCTPYCPRRKAQARPMEAHRVANTRSSSRTKCVCPAAHATSAPVAPYVPSPKKLNTRHTYTMHPSTRSTYSMVPFTRAAYSPRASRIIGRTPARNSFTHLGGSSIQSLACSSRSIMRVRGYFGVDCAKVLSRLDTTQKNFDQGLIQPGSIRYVSIGRAKILLGIDTTSKGVDRGLTSTESFRYLGVGRAKVFLGLETTQKCFAWGLTPLGSIRYLGVGHVKVFSGLDTSRER
ncbi:D-amino acid dehydrogenase small subunit [Striga asiatica]|uniref:D-amino acid dehydrogenase small subunit n=1 Tax=Striga asiatica TaxID=4170 RepID=A0A5A7P5A0_STRAF|nr:D-amino acid dehydrogenase small subunit [Striga asiatica]